MGKDEVGVEVGPGLDCRLVGVDVGEEGGGIALGGEDASLEEVDGVGCAEKVGLFRHFHGGEGQWLVGGFMNLFGAIVQECE